MTIRQCCLEQLVLDRLVTETEATNRNEDQSIINIIKCYQISIKGLMKISQNGYQGDLDREAEQREAKKRYDRLQNQIQYMLVVGSWAAGVGTIFLGIVEIYKIFHPAISPLAIPAKP
jgi:hypothetical protein